MRLNLAYIIWWWQLGYTDGWTPDSITRFGWEANEGRWSRSMKEVNERRCIFYYVGWFFISWSRLDWDARNSILEPSSVMLLQHRRSSAKKVFLKTSQNSQKNTCARVSSSQVFSCEFCEIFKNTFFLKEHLCWLFLRNYCILH